MELGLSTVDICQLAMLMALQSLLVAIYNMECGDSIFKGWLEVYNYKDTMTLELAIASLYKERPALLIIASYIQINQHVPTISVLFRNYYQFFKPCVS